MPYDPSAIIANNIGVANSMASSAQSALQSAFVSVPTTGSWGGTPIPLIEAELGDPSNPPPYGGSRYQRPAKPNESLGTLQPIPGKDFGSIPAFTGSKPAYNPPLTPSQLAEFLENPPDIDDITIPVSPEFPTAFEPPVLLDITVPDAPVVVAPVFDAQRPVLDVQAPEDLDGTYEGAYYDVFGNARRILESEFDVYIDKINPEYHNQMAAMEAKLAGFLMGGTALPVEVEQAIFNRARDKANEEYLKTRDSIYGEGAKRGFTIPGGAQYSALSQARQAMADTNARMSMDIAIKQAELEQQNMQFAITQSASLRGVVLNSGVAILGQITQLSGQAIDYAKGLVSALIEAYNAQIKLVSAAVEIYRADAAVYETRLKAALAVYDIYRAQLDGLKAQVDINQAEVAAFTAQVNAWGAVASMYKAQVDGAMASAQIEKVRADIFGTEVQAYSAQVSAKNAEWQGYTAQINGEVAKMNLYESEAKVYSTQVQAYSAKVDAYKAEVQAAASANDASARVYTAAWQGYAAAVQGEAASVSAEINSYDEVLKAYTAKAGVSESVNRVRLATDEANLRAAIQQLSLDEARTMARAKLQAEAIINNSQVAVSMGQTYAQMAGAALGGLNALASTNENTQVVA